jgi:hypothetical protein
MHPERTMMTLNVAIVSGMLSVAAALALQSGGGQTETPFFCNLKALTAAERAEQQQVTTRVLRSIRNKRELVDGFAFEVDGGRLSIKELASWVDFERRCCPFFDFHVEWRRDNGPVTVQLTGREGVKDFIRAEFEAAFR